MRNPVRAWRSGRWVARPQPAVDAQYAAQAMAFPAPINYGPPLRIGLGLIAIAVYFWGIHSYILPLGGAVQIAALVGVLIRGEKVRFPYPVVLLAVLIAWGSIGLTVTLSQQVTIDALIDLIKILVILFGLVNIVRTPAELRFIIILWLAVFAWYPIRGAIYNQYFCHCTELGRVAWNFVFSNPNDLASFCLIPLGLASGVAFAERVKIWRIAGFVGVGIVGLVIMLTQSRGVMLGMGAGVFAVLINSRRRTRDLLLATALLGVAALAAPRGVWERLGGLANASVSGGMQGVDPEGSAEARWAVWQIAAFTIRNNPITGVGAGMMPAMHRNEAARRNLPVTMRGPRDTHSTYLRLGADLGIPGLMIYLSMWIATIVHLRRARNRIKQTRPREFQVLLFIEASLIAYMVAAVFGTYGWLSFSYLNLGVAWLAANILGKEPWYVPPSASGAPVRAA